MVRKFDTLFFSLFAHICMNNRQFVDFKAFSSAAGRTRRLALKFLRKTRPFFLLVFASFCFNSANFG